MTDPLRMSDDEFSRWYAIEREQSEEREWYARSVARDREQFLEALGWHMGVLGENLAIAGALCRAWELGYDAGLYDGLERDESSCDGHWCPGCGRSAP